MNNPLFGNLKDLEKEVCIVLKENLKEKKQNESMLSIATQYISGRFGPERRAVYPVCQGDHNLTMCKEFLQMTVVESRKAVLKSKLCFQCHSGTLLAILQKKL